MVATALRREAAHKENILIVDLRDLRFDGYYVEWYTGIEYSVISQSYYSLNHRGHTLGLSMQSQCRCLDQIEERNHSTFRSVPMYWIDRG